MTMTVGDMRIDSLIDGELLSPVTRAYTNVSEDAWRASSQYREGSNLIVTMGGFVVRWGDRVVLVDAGVGSKPVYPISGGGLRSALLALNILPSDVTDVIFSHLHFDHIGWATQNGKPFFANATYRCDERDWQAFVRPDYVVPKNEALYIDPATDSAYNRLLPVADRMEFFVGDDTVLPGIESLDAAGHTPGSTVLVLSSAGERGLLLGDLVHSEPELFEQNWDFAGHADHALALEAVERFRKKIQDDDLPFAGAHFPGLHWGRLVSSKNKLGYQQVA